MRARRRIYEEVTSMFSLVGLGVTRPTHIRSFGDPPSAERAGRSSLVDVGAVLFVVIVRLRRGRLALAIRLLGRRRLVARRRFGERGPRGLAGEAYRLVGLAFEHAEQPALVAELG